MTSLENFHQALFPPEARVCGRWLRHFTPWHHALLAALRSPFLRPDGAVVTGDLLLAVEICRTTWPRRPRTRPTLRALWWRWRLDRDPILFRREAAHLGAWLDASLAGPLLWKKQGRKSPGVTAPEVLSIAYGLTSKCGLPEAEAWNKPLGLAQFILASVAELEGAEIQFADPEDLREERAPYQPQTREEVYARACKDLGQAAAERFIKAWDTRHN